MSQSWIALLLWRSGVLILQRLEEALDAPRVQRGVHVRILDFRGTVSHRTLQCGDNGPQVTWRQRQPRLRFLLNPHDFPGKLQQDCARLQTWNQTLCRSGILRQSLDSPEPAFQTEARVAAGTDHPRGLHIRELLRDAIHARLPVREFAVICHGRVAAPRGMPIRDCAGVEVVQGGFEVACISDRTLPADPKIGGRFQGTECAGERELGEPP